MNQHARYTSLRDYLRVLREQRLVILFLLLLSVGVALGLSLTQDPSYESKASMSFQDDTQDLGLLGTSIAPRIAPYTLATASAATLERDELVTGVKERLRTRMSLEDLRDAVTAVVEPNSNLVIITAKDKNADTAAAIANGFAAEGREVANDEARDRYTAAARDVRRRVRRLRKPVDPTERLIYTSQLTRLESLSTFARAATIAEPARAEEDPVSPKPVRNAIFGLLVGIALGLLAAFLRDSLDRRLRTSADVHNVLHMPLLGYVRREALGRKLAGSKDKNSAGVDLEAFRIMRRNLEFLDVDAEIKTVAVTSPLPEEGKSTVAASLALAAAASGKRTLLLECDLRRPALAARLGGAPQPGLTDHLGADATPGDVLQVLKFTNLPTPSGSNGTGPSSPQFAVVTAGAPTPRPAELLGSQRFTNLLAEVREVYDIVILDTSPLLPVVDTLEILPHVDGVILCVRVGQTTRDQAAAARSALDHFPPRPTGLVVTGTRPRDESTYGSYGYTYGYYRHHDPAGVA